MKLIFIFRKKVGGCGLQSFGSG